MNFFEVETGFQFESRSPTIQFNQTMDLPPTLFLLHIFILALKSFSELSAVQFNLFGFSIFGNQGNVITFTGTVVDRHGFIGSGNLNNPA